MSAPPDLVVDHGPLWLEVDLAAEPERWAAAAASDVAARVPPSDPGAVDALREGLLAAAHGVRRLGAVGALVLLPDPWHGVTAVARFTALDTGTPATLDDLVDEVVVADEHLARPVDVERLATAAGAAVAVTQQVVRPDDPARSVTESQQVIWAFPDRAAAVVLGIGFADLVEARRWQPDVRELAASVRVAAPAGP